MAPKNRIDTLPDELACCLEEEGAPVAITPLLLTEAQAAALLNLSKRKLWELSARGSIRSVKISALKRYRLIDLQEWVANGCPTE